MSESSISDMVFISYASPDRDRVATFYDALKDHGFNVWMDFRRLKAGQLWDFEIRRALDRAALILVFLSDSSVDRRGYAQREVKLALEKAQEKLASDIYLIPVQLDDDIAIPSDLKQRHIVKASESDCIEKIEDAIRHQLQQLGAQVAEVQGKSNVRWSTSLYRDSWDGLPGYEAEFQLLHFSSDSYAKIGEVTEIIRGKLLSQVADQRFVKFDQSSESFNFGQERFSRTNTWSAFSGEPKIVGKVMSLQYSVHYYTSGAAHPNSHFVSFCFLLDPLVKIGGLESLFDDESASFQTLQKQVRERLFNSSKEEELELDADSVKNGTEDWNSLHCFVFDKEGLEFSFAPYAVAAYAFGPQFVRVPFAEFKHLLKPWVRDALGIW